MYRLSIKIKGMIKKIPEQIIKNEIINYFKLLDIILNSENITLVKNILILEGLLKDTLNEVINKITLLKLNGEKLNILDLKLDIEEIKIEKIKKLLERKKITIEFLTPTTFKVGSNFKGKYSNYILFSWLLRKFNKKLLKEEKINISKDEIEKIISKTELENVEIKIHEYTAPAFRGKVELDFEFIDDILIESFEKLLNYGLKNNIGYKNENGYGKIKITN